MTNAAYLVAEGATDQDSRNLGRDLSNEIGRLSKLVKELLSLPYDAAQSSKPQ